jgi:D-arginine dehydrogenase
MNPNPDFIVIGAGIAGVTAAAELAAHGDVVLLEMEQQAGYHATGRSAAFFAAAYGNRVIRSLTAACESFFFNPPDGMTETGFIHPRDCMFFGRPDQRGRLEDMQSDNPRLKLLEADEVRRRVPILSADYLDSAAWDRMGGDLDVDAILQAFLRLLRKRGGQFLTNRPVTRLERSGGLWRATTSGGAASAPVVVNAAGAWADSLAGLAGLRPLGLAPLLRSAFLIDPPEGVEISGWPLMIDADEDFYFKPDAGKIMISACDETPTAPCDAQPDDMEIAIAVDRFERATGLDVRHVRHSWAGLRTFAPDRKLVVGPDPRSDGFFWLAGQGGYGVQSAPAIAQLTTALLTGTRPGGDFAPVLDFADDLAPERLL